MLSENRMRLTITALEKRARRLRAAENFQDAERTAACAYGLAQALDDPLIKRRIAELLSELAIDTFEPY